MISCHAKWVLSHNNTLTTWGGIGRTTNTYNGKGYALSLDGINDTMWKDPINMPTGTAMSVTAWIYPTGYNDPTFNGIVSWGPRSCNSSFLLSIQNTGRLSMAAWCNDLVPTSGPTVSLNVWTNVAVTMNNQSVAFYINGKLAQTGTLTSTPNIQNGRLLVGCTDTAPTRCFTGYIDDVRVYSQAMTASEIQRVYAEELTKRALAVK